MGKDKLVVLLRRAGVVVSTSMVGRILSWLKARGMLKEPPGPGVATRRRQRQRPYGVRKPRDYRAKAPGDIVQVDTLDVRPLPGVILKHFTARDVVSRYDVLEAQLGPPLAGPPSFSTPCKGECPSPCAPSRWTAAASFRPTSRRPARSGASDCSS